MSNRAGKGVIPKLLPALPAQVLHFFSAESQFCLLLDHLIKVLPIVDYQYIPGAPPYMRGLITIAGKGLPLIDLASRLGLNGSGLYTIDTPMLLCTVNGKEAGLLVDQVVGVEDVTEQQLQKNIDFDQDTNPILCAAILTERGLSFLLDAAYLLETDVAKLVGMPLGDRRETS